MSRNTAVLSVLAVLVFFLNAWSFAFLCDDAYISFRYARNLLAGHGLVFNPGEYVEGYTNFLWTLQIAAIWRYLGVGPEQSAIPLGLLSSAGMLGALGLLARTSPFDRDRSLVLVLGLTAVHRSLAVWATSGLEQRQVTAFVLLAMFAIHRGVTRRRSAWTLLGSALFGLAILSRPEPLLLTACAGAWGAWEARRTGAGDQQALRSLLQIGLPAALVAAGQLAFRLHYYGSPLPNTYYAKGRGFWLEGGLAYFAMAALEYGWAILLPLGAVGLWHRLRRGDSFHVLSIALLGPLSLYYLKIGGDHFEYRALDLHFCLITLAAVDGLLFLRSRSLRAYQAGLVAAVVYLNLLPTIDRVNTLGVDRDVPHLGWNAPTAYKAAPLVFIPGALAIAIEYDLLRRWARGHFIATRQIEHDAFCRSQKIEWGAYARVPPEDFPAALVAARGSMGVVPFYTPSVTWIDRFGLVDATVARMPVDPDRVRQAAHPRKHRVELETYVKSRVNLQLLSPRSDLESAVEGAVATRLQTGVWMRVRATGTRLRTVLPGRTLYTTGAFGGPEDLVVGSGSVWRRGARLQPAELGRLTLQNDQIVGLRIGVAGARELRILRAGEVVQTLASDQRDYVLVPLDPPGPYRIEDTRAGTRSLLAHRLTRVGPLPPP